MAVTRSFSSTVGGVINGRTVVSTQAPDAFATSTGNDAPITPLVEVLGLTGNESSALLARFSADASGPRYMMSKSRGTTVGTLANMSAEDLMGEICAAGVVGGILREGIRTQFVATVVSGAFPAGSFRVLTSDGSAAPVERFRVAHTGALQMGTTPDTVISAARHHTLRIYTVATLPSAATAAQMIYVSDGTTNKRLAVSDGTNWRWPDGAVVS